MGKIKNVLWDFVKVAFEKQTYRNILYLLFSFPLGAAYLIFLVTVLSLGFDFLLVWVGIPLFAIVLMAWDDLIAFERQMAIWLLNTDITELSLNSANDSDIFDRFIQMLKNPALWKSLAFLLLKFPLGFFSLTIVVFLVTLTFGMLISPFLYIFGSGLADSFLGSLMISISGMFMVIASMHFLNLLAYVEGIIAEKMLSSGKSVLMEKHLIADV